MREDIERLKSEVDLVPRNATLGAGSTSRSPNHTRWRWRARPWMRGPTSLWGDTPTGPRESRVHKEKPVFYGVGNFLLDQSWSEATSTGIFAEITLYGDRPIQAEPVPFVMLDYAQPNFLLPEAGGNRVLRKIYSASLGPEFEEYKANPR